VSSLVKIGFDLLRVSVPPWWVLVFGCGSAALWLIFWFAPFYSVSLRFCDCFLIRVYSRAFVAKN